MKKLIKNKQDAIRWVVGNHELKPEEISWIPDMIGFYISVNGYINYTSETNEDIKTIPLLYEDDHYKLIL